jgi:3-hydroxyacyl-CoA dehydrogenase/3a,7a,12a-trihydroxy-5b-cholest-24-enoyl-CoA hydratase
VGKLRWERAEGTLFRLSRPLTPEAVQSKWRTIVDFGRSTHPANVTESMQPILGNLGTAKGKGGNEFIDVDEALGHEMPPVESHFDERDLALYALGVGAAAADPLDPKELHYVYELSGAGFRMVPTFAVAPALKAIFDLAKEGKQAPGLHYGLDRVLHGEQYTEMRAPWPTHGKLVHKIRIKDIFDKGKHALVVTAITTTDDKGTELAYNELTTFVRGAGGWGGERGPSGDVNTPPDRAPDAVVEEKTSPSQALLYRLSGDWNPLHADPGFARGFGFDRPILHGLCTFGFAARHVIARFCPGGDSRFFKSIKVRFADAVFPGETLVTEMWDGTSAASPQRGQNLGGARKIIFVTKVKERAKVVIANAAVELFAEVPKTVAPAPSPERAAASAKAPAGTLTRPLTSADVFTGIEDHVARHPELTAKVGKSFLFKLTAPDSTWTVDLKNAPGSVKSGGATADCTLELADPDFMAMTSGKADPMKLYMGGKLKISGDLMASQKLTFLQKIDPKLALEAILRKDAGAGASGSASQASGGEAKRPEAAVVAAADAKAPGLFRALAERLAKTPSLAREVGALLQFDVKSPDGSWVVDLSGPGVVREGQDARANAVFRITDGDLVLLSRDPSLVRDFFQRGKLRVDGDVRLAQKLGFLKDLT